jgi:hypothetical protein
VAVLVLWAVVGEMLAPPVGLRSAAPVVRPLLAKEALLRSAVVAEMPSLAILLLLPMTATLSGVVRAEPWLARLR